MKYQLMWCDNEAKNGKGHVSLANNPLRVDFEMVRMIQRDLEICDIDHQLFLKTWLVKTKRRIRRELAKPVSNEHAIHSFFDEAIVKYDLGPVSEYSRYKVEAFAESLWMPVIYSDYDCTGRMFSNWIKIAVLHDHWIVYHAYGLDV